MQLSDVWTRIALATQLLEVGFLSPMFVQTYILSLLELELDPGPTTKTPETLHPQPKECQMPINPPLARRLPPPPIRYGAPRAAGAKPSMSTQNQVNPPPAPTPAIPVGRSSVYYTKAGKVELREKPDYSDLNFPTHDGCKTIFEWIEKHAGAGPLSLGIIHLSTREFDLVLGSNRKEAIGSGPCVCKKCNMTNEFANPNQKDGTYVCYSCR